MQGSFILNANHTIEVMKMVRSSLEAIRNLLGGGTQSDETRSQIERLLLLQQLLLDQEARLDAINKVLEEFNYSVAHELFAPLRRISGFTREVKQRYADGMGLYGINCLNGILQSSQQMSDLIDALIEVSRLSHLELECGKVDLSGLAASIAGDLSQGAPQRKVTFSIKPQLLTTGDHSMLKIALQKLLENAWKFTVRREGAVIEFGEKELESGKAYFVRDNGAGFDMANYEKLFHPFQRLHDPALYPGNGIGLTTVKRIVERHGGRVWAEGSPEQGANFFFTLNVPEKGS